IHHVIALRYCGKNSFWVAVTERFHVLPPMKGVRMLNSQRLTAQFGSKLATRSARDPADSEALASLGWKHRNLSPGGYIVREGQPPLRCGFILDGFAYRQKLTVNGEREIVSVLVPGDLVDLQNLYLRISDH